MAHRRRQGPTVRGTTRCGTDTSGRGGTASPGRGHPDPRDARPEKQRIRRCPGGERPLDDLAEIPDDEGEHDEERGPVCGTPWVQAEDVCAEKRAHDEGAEWQHRAEGEDELSRPSRGHSDTISKTPRSTRSG